VIGFTSAPWEKIEGREASLSAGLVLLSDPSLRVIEDFGLGHSTMGLQLARPASFLIGENREVLWRSMPRTWRHRLDPREVLELYAPKGGRP